jgi:DnaJ-class molecular chaperone
MTRKICPTCNGRGKIKNPKTMGYYVPYMKDIICPNCNGEGFIGSPDNFPVKKPIYKI